eukprot:PhF_6_TR39650/c0_g1_i1/m.58821
MNPLRKGFTIYVPEENPQPQMDDDTTRLALRPNDPSLLQRRRSSQIKDLELRRLRNKLTQLEFELTGGANSTTPMPTEPPRPRPPTYPKYSLSSPTHRGSAVGSELCLIKEEMHTMEALEYMLPSSPDPKGSMSPRSVSVLTYVTLDDIWVTESSQRYNVLMQEAEERWSIFEYEMVSKEYPNKI